MASTSAETAVFGFGQQAAKGTLATTWYQHKGVSADIAATQVVNPIAPEFGGGYHNTGMYKVMAMGAGTALLQMRLEDIIGRLLIGVVGALSETVDNQPESGMYRHVFAPPASSQSFPWYSIRRFIPGNTAAEDSGDVLMDVRSAGARFSIAGGGLLTGLFGFVARKPMLQSNALVDAWSWANTMEGAESIALASQSSVELDGQTHVVSAATIDIANQFTAPQGELVIGSGYPDDFVLLSQSVAVTLVIKWKNMDVWRMIYNNSEAAVNDYFEWSGTPWDAPATITCNSSNICVGASPYQLEFKFPSLIWNASPVGLAGRGTLVQSYTGVLQEQATAPQFQVQLENAVSSYA